MAGVALLLAGGKSVLAGVLVFAWAAYLAWRGMLDQKFLSKFSKICKSMFMPCLVFSTVADGMTMPFLRENWSLVLIGLLSMVVGWVTGEGLARFLVLPITLKPWFVLAIATPNMIAMPLVLCEAICHEQEASRSAILRCVDGYTTRLFTSSLTNTFIIWTLFPMYVRRCTEHASETTPAKQRGSKAAAALEKAGFKAVMDETPTAESPQALEEGKVVVAVREPEEAPADEAAGQAKIEQQKPQDEGLSPAPETLGRPGLLPDDEGDIEPSKQAVAPPSSCSGRVCQTIKNVWDFLLDNPPVVGNLLAVFVAVVRPVHRLFYSPAAPLTFISSACSLVGKASPGMTNLISGGTFGLQLLQLRREDPLGLRTLGISRTAMAMVVVGRLVVAPVMNLLLLFCLLPIVPRDPWSRLILVFQPAGPSANILTVLCQLLDQPEGAQLLALAAIPQMLLYVPVAVALITMGMAWNEGLQT